MGGSGGVKIEREDGGIFWGLAMSSSEYRYFFYNNLLHFTLCFVQFSVYVLYFTIYIFFQKGNVHITNKLTVKLGKQKCKRVFMTQ